MILLVLILLSGSAFALTEKDIITSVTTNFPLIEEATLKLEASKGELESSFGAFDHKLKFKSRNRIEDRYENSYIETTLERQTPYGGLGLFAGHRQGIGTFAPYDGKYKTSSAGEIFAGISLPLLRNFLTDDARTDLLKAKLANEIAGHEFELKRNLTIHKALSIYYKWVVADQKVKIRQQVLKIAEERQSMLEKKFQAGDIEKLKLTDNQRSIEKRKAELTESEIELNNFRTLLSLYYRDKNGNPVLPEVSITVDEKLPTDTFAPFNKELLPQLNLIEKELKIREADRALYSQSQLPGLNVELLGARELSGNVPYDPERLLLGVKFDFPLENRKAEGKTTASEYKYKALVKQRDYAHQELERLYKFSTDAVRMTKFRYEVTSSEFSKTKQLGQAERNRWNQGASDLYIVNLREQDTAEAEIKKWSVWFDYHQYTLDARLYSGTLLPPSDAGTI